MPNSTSKTKASQNKPKKVKVMDKVDKMDNRASQHNSGKLDAALPDELSKEMSTNYKKRRMLQMTSLMAW